MQLKLTTGQLTTLSLPFVAHGERFQGPDEVDGFLLLHAKLTLLFAEDGLETE